MLHTRKGMKALLHVLLGLVFTLRLAAEGAPDPWRKQNEFSQEQLDKVMALYHEGKRAEALQQLDRSMLLAKEEFGNSGNLYGKVWTEAQIHSGSADEEWGLDVFLCLLGTKNWKTHETDHLIYSNICGKLRSVGRITEARQLAARQQVSLATFARIDTANRPYRDLGPLFSFLPDARKRDFPMTTGDIDPNAKSDDTLIDYPRMYAVNEGATAALDVGDWVQAAELYRWFADYATAYCKHRTPRTHEVTRNSLLSFGNLAAICNWHGFPAAAEASYGEFIALVSKDGYPVEDGVLSNAILSQLVIRIELGTLPPNAVEIAEEAAETIEGFTYYGRPTKFAAWIRVARIYHATGNRTRAWEIINDLAARAKTDVNPHYQMMILGPMIDFALDEGGTHPELEAWLIRLLNYERSMGNKFNELPLYEKYAKFLRLNGRLTEAADIMKEAIRLSVAMTVPNRAEKNRAILAEILEAIKVLEEGQSRKVDLQPMSSRSMVVAGSIAYGRFYITNPSTVTKSGVLKMSGPIATDSRSSAGQISVALDTAVALKTVERPVVLEPGASFVVDVSGKGGLDDVETEFSCTWLELDEPVSEGIWVYKSSEVATRTTVVDAHAVRISPFYLIPIRHMIQRTANAGNSESVDFRISASEPMRIEVYDSTGTKLICVDANGDGDFEDKGDLVYQDLNGTGHPDLTIGENETLVSLTMYVDPAQIEAADSDASREVSISLLEDGEWHLDALDVIK
jgi:tetratricopeptide (TPR) repeat protein